MQTVHDKYGIYTLFDIHKSIMNNIDIFKVCLHLCAQSIRKPKQWRHE